MKQLIIAGLLFVAGQCGAAETLPDANAVMQRLIARAQALAQAEQGPEYTYEKRLLIEELDGRDQPANSEERVYQVRWVGGLPLERLVKIQRRQLTDAELRKEAQKEERLRQKFAGVDVKKKAAQKEGWVTTRLLERYQFQVQERIILHERPTLVVSFRPKTGKLPAKTIPDKLLNQLAGTVWVDEAEADAVKFSVTLLEPVSLGWFGILGSLNRCELVSERQRMTAGVWIAAHQSLLVKGRMFSSAFRFRVTENSSGFQPAASAHDVVVYGGTSAGVIAAVQAKKMDKSVVIVCPDKHLGGLSSGGLGFTDTGDKAVIGGLSREFYHRVWQHYEKPDAWRWQKREEYGNKGQGTPAIDGTERTMWIFEPHVAEQVFEDFIKEHQIPVHRGEWLDRANGVKKNGARITAITMLSGKTYTGKMFIDATYEGDLMAAAGIEYHVGREAKSTYDEQWNGVQTGVLHHRHHFGVLKEKVSPYVVPGDPASGVLPRISTKPPGAYGAADKGVQAYCFRMCLTDATENRIPFLKPEGYDPKQYELLLRIFNAGWRETFEKFDPIPNHKTDTNNHGPFSTDNIGYNHDYPEASYDRRREIIREHETYQKGWLYFIANDPRIPKDVQDEMRRWGLPKDEFTDNGNWSHQIYVREARRMIGRHVMTENELLKRRPTPEPVGMGSYGMDSHNIQRYITPEGYVQNEGDIGVSTKGPYSISFGSLVPKPGQCDNLLVPVCVSSSHIAYGSIRMEPVFMILGQSAATAACLAIDDKVPVQNVAYDKLRARLLADKQILEGTGSGKTGLPGIVLDSHQAKLIGEWQTSGPYQHDQNTGKGAKSARFELKVPSDGLYEIRLAYVANRNRATNVPVTIESADGAKTVRVNQKNTPPLEGRTVSLGKFTFTADKPAVVTVSNAGTDGYVIIDAVQLLPMK